MRKLILSAAIVLASAIPAAGERINIRSGEHPGFSRLVFTLDFPGGWILGRTAGGYGLRFTRDDVDFALDEVFRRIPRDRIRAIVETKSHLQIDIGCDCHANAFELRPGLLVIDIADGPPNPGTQFEIPLARIPQSEIYGGDLTNLYWRELLGAAPSGMVEAKPTEGVTKIDHSTSAGEDIRAFHPLGAPRVSEVADQLGNDLARAAAQGLVELDLSKIPPMVHAGPLASLAIHSETAIDRDLGPKFREPDTPACAPSSALDINSWGSDEPFAEQLSAARRVLISEFDTPSPSGVENLIHVYLYFAMGAEANAALSAFPDVIPSHSAKILKTISQIVDGKLRVDIGALDGLSRCDSPVALWAFLADPTISSTRDIARDAILRSFSALPPHVRRAVAPALARRIAQRNDLIGASMVLDASRRAGGAEDQEIRLIRAELGYDITTRTLAEIAKSGSPAAAEATLILANNHLATGKPIDAALAIDISAYAFELRGTVLGEKLTAAYILAYGASGDFDKAFEALELHSLDIGSEAEKASIDLFTMLTSRASDEVFLRHALRSLAQQGFHSRELRIGMAHRLVTLGFAQAAEKVMKDVIPLSPDDRRIAAEIKLATEDPREALRVLAGTIEPDVEKLRGRILQEIGNGGAAYEAFERAGDTAAASRSAWRRGDWSKVAISDSPEERAVAKLHQELKIDERLRVLEDLDMATGRSDDAPQAVTAESQSRPLSRGRNLVSESQSAREALEALIAARQIP